MWRPSIDRGARRAPVQRDGLRRAFRNLRVVRWFAVTGLILALIPHLYLRGIADNTDIPRQQLLARAESSIAGGALPTEHLQSLFHLVRVPLFDELWVFVYALWLPAGLLGIVAFAVRSWSRFTSFAVALLALFYISDLLFLLVPTQPPWMLPGVARIIVDVTGDVVRRDTNYVAAFPSLHVAVPALIAFRARASGMSRWWAAYAVFASLTAFAVVYLGEHFLLDAVAGALIAWGAVWATSRLDRAAGEQVGGEVVPLPSVRQDAA